MYGVSIMAFIIGIGVVALGYPAFQETVSVRATAALFATAAMAFVPSAWSLPPLMARVVNMGTLTPAVLYPFVTGLRFIPAFVLVLGYWVVLAGRQDKGFVEIPLVRRTYLSLGAGFLLMTVLAVAMSYGDVQIWQAKLPERWAILVCDAAVLAINLTVFLFAYHFSRQRQISTYGRLFAICAVAYVFLSIPAVIVDQEYNRVNRYRLDARRPDAYVATNPDASKRTGGARRPP